MWLFVKCGIWSKKRMLAQELGKNALAGTGEEGSRWITIQRQCCEQVLPIWCVPTKTGGPWSA
jgi:hypothetical protein